MTYNSCNLYCIKGGEEMKRIQVNIADEMATRIDEYAKKMGVSRSSLCAVFIGQGIMNYDRATDLVATLGDQLKQEIIAETMKEKL